MLQTNGIPKKDVISNETHANKGDYKIKNLVHIYLYDIEANKTLHMHCAFLADSLNFRIVRLFVLERVAIVVISAAKTWYLNKFKSLTLFIRFDPEQHIKMESTSSACSRNTQYYYTCYVWLWFCYVEDSFPHFSGPLEHLLAPRRLPDERFQPQLKRRFRLFHLCVIQCSVCPLQWAIRRVWWAHKRYACKCYNKAAEKQQYCACRSPKKWIPGQICTHAPGELKRKPMHVLHTYYTRHTSITEIRTWKHDYSTLYFSDFSLLLGRARWYIDSHLCVNKHFGMVQVARLNVPVKLHLLKNQIMYCIFWGSEGERTRGKA